MTSRRPGRGRAGFHRLDPTARRRQIRNSTWMAIRPQMTSGREQLADEPRARGRQDDPDPDGEGDEHGVRKRIAPAAPPGDQVAEARDQRVEDGRDVARRRGAGVADVTLSAASICHRRRVAALVQAGRARCVAGAVPDLPPGAMRYHRRRSTGEWPSGKAPDSGSGDRRFEILPRQPTHKSCAPRVPTGPGRRPKQGSPGWVAQSLAALLQGLGSLLLWRPMSHATSTARVGPEHDSAERVASLASQARRGPVTLVYGARDRRPNQARVIADELERRIRD